MPAVEVPVIVPKTSADVEMLVKATMEFLAYHQSSLPEEEIREAIHMAARFKTVYLRPFTHEEMRNRW